MAYRRVSNPDRTRQLYFLLFDAPPFQRFREQIATLLDAAAGGHLDYDPAALSPVLFVAATDTEFNRWLPMKANPAVDCVAPISASP